MNDVMRRAIHLGIPYAKDLLGAPAHYHHAPSLRIRQWLKARTEALRSMCPIYQGHRIQWAVPGHAWCIPFDLSGPAKHEVLIRTIASAISLGTEEAFFSRRPNTSTTFPSHSGYSLAGEIVSVGRHVSHLAVGQLVATRASHVSLAKVPASAVFAVPDGVLPTAAAFVQLGLVTYHGVWRSRLQAGERVAVFGRGLVGQLTTQISRALGAREIISIAPSRQRITETLQRYADRSIATDEEPHDVCRHLEVDIAYEVSGHPMAIREAVAATRPHGRVVLLGSPRGVTHDFALGMLADKHITLLGAQISTQSPQDARKAGDAFLRLLAEGQINVLDLIDLEVNPWEAGRFYRSLAEGQVPAVAALFRWDRLAAGDRMQRVPYWTRPNWEAEDRSSIRTALLPHASLASEASPAMPAPAVAHRRTAADHPRLRVAIVGGGERGMINARAAQEVPHTSLALIMDVNESSAKRLGEHMGVPWTTDYEAVLANERVDLVFISTPNYLHAEQAMLAAQAGKHVIVEKPLATTVYDATRMVQAARQYGVQLSMWLGFRYLPHVAKGRQLVEAGALGTLLGGHLACHNYKPPSYYRAGYSGTGTDWRTHWKISGGGVFIMNGIHYLDWLLYLSELTVTEVFSRYATLDSAAEVEDAMVMCLTCDNGALMTINVAACVQGMATAEHVELRLWGTEGQLSLTPPYQFYSSHLIDEKPPERWHTLAPFPKYRAPHLEYLDRFAQAVLQGKPLDITAQDGLRLQAIIEAAYLSSQQGRPVLVQYPEV